MSPHMESATSYWAMSLTSSFDEISPAASDHPTSEKTTERGILRVVQSVHTFCEAECWW